MTAQMARKPLFEDVAVNSELVIGPRAKKPLILKTPLFVSDMSFGALSEEAKLSLSMGAELAGTGICSGEGGLDGRGGGPGAAPEMFRDHISVSTIPALPRARRYLNEQGASGKVTLIITGSLRVPMDFVKAMALGADGVAISNSAMQPIGCVAARICSTNNCPAVIATQKADLRHLHVNYIIRLNAACFKHRSCSLLHRLSHRIHGQSCVYSRCIYVFMVKALTYNRQARTCISLP
jgi:glutamate synthase domain-containing protein 2